MAGKVSTQFYRSRDIRAWEECSGHTRDMLEHSRDYVKFSRSTINVTAADP